MKGTMRQPIVDIVYNPASGGYAADRIDALRAAFAERGADVRLSATGRDGVTVNPEADHVCVAGGDGTVRQVVEALHRAGLDPTISICPTGTVNLLMLETGQDGAPEAIAARVLGGDDIRTHYGVAVNDTLFLACANVGPEAWAVERVSSGLKRWIGRFAYAVALLPLLIRWPRTPIRLAVDAPAAGRRTIDCEAFYVAKGRYFAGRWRLSAEASLQRPDIRVVALATARRIDMARFWCRLALHRPIETMPGVTAFACTALTATSAVPLAVQADGDIATTLPARFEIMAQPLRFA
ncbi:diacylglycerol/lipid kinase family protein [Sphingomonas abietis]|uniref:Diacylglycerol kinase family protein n=1 Tax=Sphingomonas abietis TaxID=3012344 RepID=A0ABY7NH87_9SPHN|nr:diacylglycerol kinase family protein [Sphingomonas abietis]WBO20888.1 diacylglycerol kinase family protein [Sphingomonas abietis]